MSKKKRYKKHNVDNTKHKIKIITAYYKRNLDIFIERELNVKLTWWQRFILKRMRFKDGKKNKK